ncbi:MAG: hypothetical protein D3905_05815, partial [Candidatus Electrothrix sp. AS4_5]|nr:hypothetical protein [Candidatus Electrothrix gigas]
DPRLSFFIDLKNLTDEDAVVYGGGSPGKEALVPVYGQQFLVGQDVPIKFSVVFTDGQDTASHRYRDEASFRSHIIGLTSNYTIPLFIVGVGDVNVNLLHSISQFGHFKHVQNVPDIDQLFDFVEELIKATYIFKIPAILNLDQLETIFIVEKLSSGKFKTIQDVPVN